MAISNIRSAHGGTTTGSTAINFTHGLTIASGDFLIAQIQTNDGTFTLSDNNGATPWAQQDAAASGESSRHAIWYRTAGASEPANFQWTVSGSTSYGITVHAIAGADGWDVAPAAGNRQSGTISGSSLAINSITIVTDGALGMVFVGCDSSTTPFFSLSTANGYGNETENTVGRRVAVYYAAGLAVGAKTGPTIATVDNADGYVAWHCAVKPAAGAATTLRDEWGMMGFYGV